MYSLKQRIIEINEQQNAMFAAISALGAPTFDKEEATKSNPYQSLPLFKDNKPENAEVAAAMLVAAYGKEHAYGVAMARADSADAPQEVHAWEFLAETIDSLLEASDGTVSSPPEKSEATGTQESFSLNITLNEKQLVAKDFAYQGKSFCYIGPAGTGKTTGQRAVAKALLEDGKLSSTDFKLVGASRVTAPSIAFCAYTRRAASNLRKAIHKDPSLESALRNNIMTIHGLLEFQPVTFFDPIDQKDKFRFLPQKTADNPLTITHLIIEEASMLGLDLWENLYDALPPGVQIIFIGDINQLPPVFGPSILNYALIQLPIVELTEVYRNQGIVLENAHNILAGRNIVETENFEIIRGKSDTQVGQERMAQSLYRVFESMSNTIGDDGLPLYDVENDIILSPFNKQALGTDNMNRWIAQFVGDKRGAIVHEVIAGFNKLYLAVGDKVMVNKRDGVIIDLYKNPSYYGKEPQLAGADLSRFGDRIAGRGASLDLDEMASDLEGALNYENFSLEKLEDEQAERKQQASHVIKVSYGEGMAEEEITAVGDLSPQVFSLGYCLTIHKAQGSEWRKVFIIFHKDHSIMLFRELFYTAVTRARTKVCIIAKDFLIKKAIETQRIKGNTLADKLAFFNSGVNANDGVKCTKPIAEEGEENV